MEFRIRYADGGLYEGDWRNAPGYGVQTIVYPEAGDVTLRHQGHFFRLDNDGCVVAMDWVSLLHYVIDDLRIVKAGSMVSRDKYAEILQAAKADRDAMRGVD